MKELNLTQGSVPKVLLQFAVPFLIANVLQALYGGADLFVVGQYDDSASVAAVASGIYNRFFRMAVFNRRCFADFSHGRVSRADSRTDAYACGSNG